MVHDRGSIKWTSLMLPEHVELLKSIWNEDKKINRPILDEQELERLNDHLLEAFQHKQLVQIEYYQHAQMFEVQGIIKKFDQLDQKILMEDTNKEVFSIAFNNIIQVI